MILLCILEVALVVFIVWAIIEGTLPPPPSKPTKQPRDAKGRFMKRSSNVEKKR